MGGSAGRAFALVLIVLIVMMVISGVVSGPIQVIMGMKPSSVRVKFLPERCVL